MLQLLVTAADGLYPHIASHYSHIPTSTVNDSVANHENDTTQALMLSVGSRNFFQIKGIPRIDRVLDSAKIWIESSFDLMVTFHLDSRRLRRKLR